MVSTLLSATSWGADPPKHLRRSGRAFGLDDSESSQNPQCVPGLLPALDQDATDGGLGGRVEVRIGLDALEHGSGVPELAEEAVDRRHQPLPLFQPGPGLVAAHIGR